MVHGENRISYRIDRRLSGLAGPDYDATISFGLPIEPEDSQYGEYRMKPVNLRIGSSVAYDTQIGDSLVSVVSPSDSVGEPGFGSILSSGDRSALAFAFFLSAVDRLPDPERTIVVIDDPISSMDANRSLVTVQAIRSLSNKVAQTIVLSHDKRFLCRLWEHAARATCSVFEITKAGQGSTIREWDVSEDALSEHDRRYYAFVEYLNTGSGSPQDIASDIRLPLDGFIRATCPQEFAAGSSLGKPFLCRCKGQSWFTRAKLCQPLEFRSWRKFWNTRTRSIMRLIQIGLQCQLMMVNFVRL